MNTKTKTNKMLNKGVILSIAICSILIFSAAAQASQLITSTNRLVVLDDPKSGSTGSGFFNPPHNWGTTDYWNGESTTIRAIALLLDDNGLPLSGITVTFRAKNATGSTKNTASVTTDSKGMAYYSYNLNNNASWGYWKVEANTTIAGSNIQSNASFASMWWGCAQCHGSEDPGKWGTMYTPKSYYTMGYDFHKSSDKNKHIEPMTKGNCITCHTMYNGTPVDRGYIDNSPTINTENEYSPDWHNGKVKCQDCHAGSNLTKQSNSGQGKNPEIAGCYDTAGCHTKKNTNLTGVNSTTGYVVGGNYKTNYSDIQNSNVAKAHNASGTGVTCIACHDAGHNITKPYNVSSTSNSYTENDQCWACHSTRPTHYGTTCTDCHSQNAHRVTKGVGGENCASCHPAYANAVGNTMHNQSKNAGAPACKGCHINYNSTSGLGHNGYIVNEANTCRNAGCHNTKDESHGTLQTSGADCTQCHFANTTQKFDKDQSLYAHDHNLTVEHNFYEYSQFGIPLESNSGIGKGMFPYYTCTLTCHNGNIGGQSKIEKEVISWNESAHARSLRYPGANDNKNNCAKCKSPPNYNDSLKVANPNVSAADWQGIQCRVCHNLHNDSYSGTTSPAFPIAFYNATASSLTGSPVYDKVSGSTQLCEKCHTGATHDSKFAGTHKNAGMGCADCHANSSLSDESHNFEVKNTATGAIGCEVCHNPVDHTFQFTANHAGNVTCDACHDKTVSRNVTGFAVSSDNNYGIYKDPLTGEWSSYKMSHGVPATWPLHNITRDVSCDKCHGAYSLYNGTVRQNTLIVQTGGADCKSCHDIGGIAPVHVNFTVAGETDALHSGLNRDASSTVDPDNKKCWACHGDGTQPTSGHPSNYRTPYTCENCHVQVQGSYNPSAISTVDNHYWNGTNITTAGVSSCQQCHNKTEMMLSVSGSEVVDNPNHYGKKRPDLGTLSGTNAYCEYCHSSTVNGATFYVSDYNNSIVNHSVSSNTPLCTNCHNTGRLHDSEIAKPVSSDTLCKTCHFGKSEHNNTLSCTECHANNSDGSLAGKDIHEIKFLQKDNTFSQDRVNSADCTTCHQLSVVDGSIGIAPPKISDPLHHSDDATNGSKWGTYWTGANPITACIYCHNDTRHSATPLGRPLIWNTSYIMGTTIGTGTNCADCHQKGDSDYNAMKLTFEAKALPIPPEITNGSWNGKPGYFNHTLADYTDSRCQGCHYQGSSTVGQMLHDVSVGGGGGTGCIECHNSISPSSSMTVDIDVFNNSIHQNINNSVPDGTVTNDDCWACHYNQDMNRQNIRKCKDCHAKPSQWHGNANIDTNLTNLSII